jgi:SAM-dependent methyltransferase
MKKASHGEDGVIKFTQLMKKDSLFTVLDIGCGVDQIHVNYMKKQGLKAYGIDLIDGVDIQENYNTFEFNKNAFDGIHAAHVLEHQLNPNLFLKKIYLDLKDNGWLCITVPPFKHQIVGGHVSLWNAGLVLYHLVHAGFNCSDAKINTYGYNISVIIQKKPITEVIPYTYNSEDITLIKNYLPKVNFKRNNLGEFTFDGNIQSLNW